MSFTNKTVSSDRLSHPQISVTKAEGGRFMLSCDSAAHLDSFIDRMKNLEVTTMSVPCSVSFNEVLGNANIMERSNMFLSLLNLGQC